MYYIYYILYINTAHTFQPANDGMEISDELHQPKMGSYRQKPYLALPRPGLKGLGPKFMSLSMNNSPVEALTHSHMENGSSLCHSLIPLDDPLPLTKRGKACQNWLSPTKYPKILCLISFIILFPIRIAIFGMYATFSAQTNSTNPNGSGSKLDTQK